MPAPAILADGLGKGYGGPTLFDDAAFQVVLGTRVALVGPNGAGKSTLLRILAGREKPDHGTIRLQPGGAVHWFDQHAHIPDGATARDLLAAPKAVPAALAAELAELEERVADPALYEAPGYEAVLERYAQAQQEAKEASRPTGDALPLGLLRDLGFEESDLTQSAASMSGGEKTRLLLARTLAPVRPGDMLVLDEPTNHLDVDSIEWLEDRLRSHDGTVLVVAHDRVFLDNVAQMVLEVAQGRITAYDGDYEDYAQARDEEVQRQQREHEKAQDRLQAAKAVIQQFRHQKRFDGQYASRMKSLEKYQAALEKAPDPVLEKLAFGLGFDHVEKSGLEVIRATGVRKSFAGHEVLKGADLEVKRGDRIGLVGGNGQGKSTLLSILTGKLAKDSGTIHVAPGVKGMVFSQEQDDLRPERTMHQEVLDARGSLEERDVKALLGRFRFRPEVDLGRPVSSLSGGERQRLKLLKCILKPSNLLVLDEPTNHLDLWARDVVVDALNAYKGTLLVVSHDRYLLDATTGKTAVLEGGHVHMYEGSFTETRDLHRVRRSAPTAGDTYVVRKRFTDWTTNTKYAPEQQVTLTPAQVSGSMTIRNAIQQGWLARA